MSFYYPRSLFVEERYLEELYRIYDLARRSRALPLALEDAKEKMEKESERHKLEQEKKQLEWERKEFEWKKREFELVQLLQKNGVEVSKEEDDHKKQKVTIETKEESKTKEEEDLLVRQQDFEKYLLETMTEKCLHCGGRLAPVEDGLVSRTCLIGSGTQSFPGAYNSKSDLVLYHSLESGGCGKPVRIVYGGLVKQEEATKEEEEESKTKEEPEEVQVTTFSNGEVVEVEDEEDEETVIVDTFQELNLDDGTPLIQEVAQVTTTN